MAPKAEKRSRSSADAGNNNSTTTAAAAAPSTSSEKSSAARRSSTAASNKKPTDKKAVREENKKTRSPTKRRSHTVEGKLQRSADALACLAKKKTEKEIWASVVPFVRKTQDSDYDPATMLKFVSWNVAGLRGLLKRNAGALQELVHATQPDVLCLQETKLNVDDAAQNAQLGLIEGYTFIDHPCAACKGYSGTRTYCRESTILSTYRARSSCGFTLPVEYASKEAESKAKQNNSTSDTPEAMPLVEDVEGRVLTTLLAPAQAKASSTNNTTTTTASNSVDEWRPSLAIVNTYIPNSGMSLDRLPYRTELFDARIRAFLKQLDHLCTGSNTNEGNARKKESGTRPGGFIWTGDLNVAERDFDRYFSGTYRTMQDVSGFTPEERASFRQTLDETRAVDAFRMLYPQSGPSYTFWSARIHGREKNLGWRLDYFVLSAALATHVVDCFPMPEVKGSDHCPVQLWLKKL